VCRGKDGRIRWLGHCESSTPGAHYHVTNRGNQRGTVFHKKSDYELFLEKLERFAGLFRVRLLSYCSVGNHFHLYLRTEEANLSRFMQSSLTSFTVSLNLSAGV